MADSFDPYYTWLGIPPEEQPADHYRLLGVRRFEANEEVILNASDQRMGYVRTFQTGKRSKESQALLNEISAAQICLLNPDKKKAYDDDLRRKLAQTSSSRPAEKPSEPLPAARSAPTLARPLPVAAPLQPIQPHPSLQRPAALAAADPFSLVELDPLAPAQVAASPLRPVVAPKPDDLWTPRTLIIAGSAAGTLIVLVGLVAWAATRPGSTPVANVSAGEHSTPTAPSADALPRPPAPSSVSNRTTPSSIPVPAVPSESPRPANPAPPPPTSTAGSGGNDSPAAPSSPPTVTPAPMPLPAPISPLVPMPSPPSAAPMPSESPAPAPPSERAATIDDVPASGNPVSPAEMAIAHRELKAAGVSLSDDPKFVGMIQTHNTAVTVDHVSHLGAFPNLEYLYLEGIADTPAILHQIKPLPKLKSLSLKGSTVTDDDLVHLKKFPRIQSLYLEQTKVHGPGLVQLKHTPLLTELSLPKTLSREFLPHVCQLQLLQKCEFPEGLTDDDLKLIGQLTKLTGLNLLDANITPDGLRHIENLKDLESIGLQPHAPPEALRHLAKLNFKVFYFPQQAGDEEVAYFAKMDRLEHVVGPPRMTDEGMKVLGTFPALQKLNLGVCQSVGDVGMLELARCKTLREIELPENITDAGLVPISALPELESISMRSQAITPAGIATLAVAPKLTGLTIGNIATPEVAAALQRLSRVESLGVFYEGSSNAEFIRGLKDMKQLKNLNFSQVRFDDESVAALHQFSGLESLLIQQHKLSPEQLDALTKALPKCRIGNW